MKKKLIALALLAGLTSAHARVGETVAQIEARYGLPVAGNPEVPPPRDELGNEIRVYNFHHFAITVTFAGGISQAELFAKYKDHMMSESWETLTQAEVDAILAAYESAGVRWQPGEALGTAKRPLRWTSTDGRLKATYMFNQLQIGVNDYINRRAEAVKRKEAEKLKGF